uniref:ACB domain-containing protein n=1 Tax=Macrostomum lignano TaxID=282301 RepID=A0A1I8FFS3_9PLAT
LQANTQMDDEGVAMLEAANADKNRICAFTQRLLHCQIPANYSGNNGVSFACLHCSFRDGVHANGAESAARHCGLDRPGHYCLPVPNVTNMVWIGLQCVRCKLSVSLPPAAPASRVIDFLLLHCAGRDQCHPLVPSSSFDLCYFISHDRSQTNFSKPVLQVVNTESLCWLHRLCLADRFPLISPPLDSELSISSPLLSVRKIYERPFNQLAGGRGDLCCSGGFNIGEGNLLSCALFLACGVCASLVPASDALMPAGQRQPCRCPAATDIVPDSAATGEAADPVACLLCRKSFPTPTECARHSLLCCEPSLLQCRFRIRQHRSVPSLLAAFIHCSSSPAVCEFLQLPNHRSREQSAGSSCLPALSIASGFLIVNAAPSQDGQLLLPSASLALPRLPPPPPACLPNSRSHSGSNVSSIVLCQRSSAATTANSDVVSCGQQRQSISLFHPALQSSNSSNYVRAVGCLSSQNGDSPGPMQPHPMPLTDRRGLLTFYSLYRQATAGPCRVAAPPPGDPIGRAKWSAWSALGEMPRLAAMRAYVAELHQLALDSADTSSPELTRFLELVADGIDEDDDGVNGCSWEGRKPVPTYPIDEPIGSDEEQLADGGIGRDDNGEVDGSDGENGRNDNAEVDGSDGENGRDDNGEVDGSDGENDKDDNGEVDGSNGENGEIDESDESTNLRPPWPTTAWRRRPTQALVRLHADLQRLLSATDTAVRREQSSAVAGRRRGGRISDLWDAFAAFAAAAAAVWVVLLLWRRRLR